VIEARSGKEEDEGGAEKRIGEDHEGIVASRRGEDKDDEGRDGEEGADAVGQGVRDLLGTGIAALWGRGVAG
jgi:hypothetical protein